MPHGLREEAVKVVRGISSFLDVVMENNRFGDNFRIKSLISMLWNEELKVPKVAKRSYDWMGGICDVGPI